MVAFSFINMFELQGKVSRLPDNYIENAFVGLGT